MSNIHSLNDEEIPPQSNAPRRDENIQYFDPNEQDPDDSPLPKVIDIIQPGLTICSVNFWLCMIIGIVFIGELCYNWSVNGSPFDQNVKSLGPGVSTLILLRAGQKSLIQNMEIDRLFVPIFLHADVLHIFFNLAFQTMLCYRFEAKWGHLRFFAFWFYSGFFGFCFSCAINNSAKCGASGALVGTIGAQISYLMMNWNAGTEQEQFARQMEMCNLACFAIIIGIFLLFGFVAQVSDQGQPFLSGIDHFGHFGGLVAGLLIGLSFSAKVENPLSCLRSRAVTYAPVIAVLVLNAGCLLALFLTSA